MSLSPSQGRLTSLKPGTENYLIFSTKNVWGKLSARILCFYINCMWCALRICRSPLRTAPDSVLKDLIWFLFYSLLFVTKSQFLPNCKSRSSLIKSHSCCPFLSLIVIKYKKQQQAKWNLIYANITCPSRTMSLTMRMLLWCTPAAYVAVQTNPWSINTPFSSLPKQDSVCNTTKAAYKCTEEHDK